MRLWDVKVSLLTLGFCDAQEQEMVEDICLLWLIVYTVLINTVHSYPLI